MWIIQRKSLCECRITIETIAYLSKHANVAILTVPELQLASYESEGPENNLERDTRRSLR